MKTIAISEFKAKCIALSKEVAERGEELLVTLRGAPLVKVSAPDTGSERMLGGQAGACRPAGGNWGVLEDSDFEDDWE